MDRYDLDRKEKIWPLFSKCKLHSKSSKHFDPEVAMSTAKKGWRSKGALRVCVHHLSISVSLFTFFLLFFQLFRETNYV